MTPDKSANSPIASLMTPDKVARLPRFGPAEQRFDIDRDKKPEKRLLQPAE
jgi:hypothetical protein